LDTPLVAALALVALLLLAVLYLQLRRPPGGPDLSTPLQSLTQAVQSAQTQTAVLAEKLAHLEPLAQVVSGVQVELKGVAERVSAVERGQAAVGQNVQSLGTALARTDAAARTLMEATEAMRAELSQARNSLTELHTHSKARQEAEQRSAESLRRLETIIAGTQAKGSAGENILEIVFAQLPAEWQVRDFKVGGRVVEFGLRLPNHLILPIDSKWPATSLLEQFTASEDPVERQRLKGQVEQAVLAKAREVKKYLDPGITVGFGVAAVPDAVYELCYGVQAQTFQENVVLVPYSMFVPYLLLVFQTVLQTSHNLDLEKLSAYLDTFQSSVQALQEELEGRFSRALTMLTNSRSDMSAHLSRASGALTSLQIGAGTAVALVSLPDPEAAEGVASLSSPANR